MAIPLLLFLENGHNYIALTLIILIVLSDVLDGYVARKADGITNFGKIIDPIADKICMMVVIVYLLFEYHTPFFIYLILLTFRDILLIIVGGWLINNNVEIFQSIRSGKWFVGISALMMFFYLIQMPEYGQYLYPVVMILMAVSTYQYFVRYVQYYRELNPE